MNNSQPDFNDRSFRAVILMSGVKEADPGGKRVHVCAMQLRVSFFLLWSNSLLGTQRCDWVVDVITRSWRDIKNIFCIIWRQSIVK